MASSKCIVQFLKTIFITPQCLLNFLITSWEAQPTSLFEASCWEIECFNFQLALLSFRYYLWVRREMSWRYKGGVVLIISVVLLWVTSAEVTQVSSLSLSLSLSKLDFIALFLFLFLFFFFFGIRFQVLVYINVLSW